jgi:hypothetical protein
MKQFGSACSKLVVFTCLMLIAAVPASANVVFPGQNPGTPSVSANKTEISLGNKVLRASWWFNGQNLKPGQFTNKITGKTIELGDSLFQIVLADGHTADLHPFIRCWHVADGAVQWSQVVPGTVPRDTVGALAFSPDGQRIAAVDGRTLPILRASDGANRRRLLWTVSA